MTKLASPSRLFTQVQFGLLGSGTRSHSPRTNAPRTKDADTGTDAGTETETPPFVTQTQIPTHAHAQATPTLTDSCADRFNIVATL